MSTTQNKQPISIEIIEKLHSLDFFMIFLTFGMVFDSFIVYFFKTNLLSLKAKQLIEFPNMLIFFFLLYGAIITIILPIINYFMTFVLIKIMPSKRIPNINSVVPAIG